MNPAILDILQQQMQLSADGSTPTGQVMGYGTTPVAAPPIYKRPLQGSRAPQRSAPFPPVQEASAYDPFNAGVQKAIQSAHASRAMTSDQRDKAIRKGLYEYGNEIGKIPREKGFLANLLTGIGGLGTAVNAYDQAEDQYVADNQKLVNEVIEHQRAQAAAEAAERERAWYRQHAADQLAEAQRFHDLSYDTHQQQGKGKHDAGDPAAILKTFDYMDKTIEELGELGQRSKIARLVGSKIPLNLSEKQAEVNTLDEILKGQLFNAWGYRNQAEFEKLPHISIDNPPEVNRAILKQLKNVTRVKMGMPLDQGMPTSDSSSSFMPAAVNGIPPLGNFEEPSGLTAAPRKIRMKRPDGIIVEVDPVDIEDAKKDKLVAI